MSRHHILMHDRPTFGGDIVTATLISIVSPAVEFKSLSLSILEYLEVPVFILEDVHLSLFTGNISILGASADGADGG